MKHRGRLTAAGSAIFTAIAASAGFMWAEDEFWPAESQSPPLSDPDSDALYASNTHDDAPDPSLDMHLDDHARWTIAADHETHPYKIAPHGQAEAVHPDHSADPSPSLTLDIAPQSASAEPPPRLASAEIPEQPEPVAPALGVDTVTPERDAPAFAAAAANAVKDLTTAPQARPLNLPLTPVSATPAAPQPAALQIADMAPAPPADQPEHETRRSAQPVPQFSSSAPAPSALRAATSSSRGGFASGSPLDTPTYASVEYPAPPRAAADPANTATPVPPLSQPFPSALVPPADQAAPSPDVGGFTSSSALDVFAPAEQLATPPLLTPASYSSSPASSQAYSDSERVFDANPRGPGRGNGGASSDTTEAEMLVLAPVVNGTPTSQVITVERRSSGFSARAGDLRALRIKLDPSINDEDTVALASLPGLEARYIDATQSLDLKVPDTLLTATQIEGLQGRTPIDISKITTTRGVLLNYRLFGSLETGRKTQLTGDVEFVRTAGIGTFATTGFFATNGRKTFVRGDSFFRLEDNAHVRTYTAGDFASGAVSFSRSVRLGGVQVQSDFEQRPDLFTGPLPRFAGSAALPSSVDLYIDSLKVFSANVPQGPFVLNSLPQISGNELRIVTTDVNGRQTQITSPYFNAPGLLRKGLVEYSAELGAPRIDSGLRSFGYRGQIFASVTGRYGLGNRLTMEGHAETGGGLINGGLGFIQALGKLGSLTTSASASNYRGKQGAKLSAQYRFDQKRFSLFANAEREYGRYFDLGDISSFRGPITDPAGVPLFPLRQRRSIERIGVSYRPAFDPVSFNVAYNHLRQGNSEIRTANLALRRRITNRISFNGNAIYDLERRHDVALSIGLDVRLGRDARAFVGADRANGRTNYNVSATGFSGGRQNALGYSISQRGNDDGDAFRSASLNYRFPQAFVAGTIDQSGSKVRGSVQLEGSLIAAGKDVFVANRIGEGFAIVKNAGPHVGILQGGRKIATSNGKGRALLPSLEPFSETRLSIDPATLPADLEAENGTDFRVVTARRRAALVDFGVRKVNAAIVVIFGKDGKPIQPGTQIDIGGKEPGLMGYDGEVFLKDLKPQNRINIDLGPAGKCSATFSYDINGEAQPRIGPITCS